MPIASVDDLAKIDDDFLMPPDTFESINNYIDELIRRLQAKSSVAASGSEPYYRVTATDLRYLKQRLAQLKRNSDAP